MTPLRAIPAVEKVLQELGAIDIPRPALVAIVRRELATLRKQKTIPNQTEIITQIRTAVEKLRRSKIQPVINGTGIIVHTNLGRAILPKAAQHALQQVASQYNTLEYDLTTGDRGSRATYLEHNLAVLCGAEAATVVNNCAAALVLILHHFTGDETRKDVIINRGELVQIGGGFRIPEILESSGAILREVGTTNKTSLSDYAKAITRETAMILKVHRSNFFMSGFTDAPETSALADLAHKKKIPFIEDLGSGAVVQTERFPGCEHEPTPAEILKQGVDLVCFSGDKLLGGPQAGIIAGKAKMIAALKRDPLFRALRCDKLILTALESTVDLYLSSNAPSEIPTFAMLQTSETDLQTRAQNILTALRDLPVTTAIGKGHSQIGGGTLPRSAVPSVTVEMKPQHCSLEQFAARLRLPKTGLPVIGYISHGRYKLDLRTIFAEQDVQVIEAIRNACK